METRRSTNPEAEEIIGRYFPALDHGFVSLVDYMGTDADVETAARVSYGAGTRKTSETRGLIRYLRRHKHTTPSEMVELKFHCCMPIFVARQWIRHRTANVNEMSGRYSLLPMLFYTPDAAHLQTQSKTNKQGQSGNVVQSGLYEAAAARWSAHRIDVANDYAWLNTNDVARELARIDLPLSTYTQWYWKIDLHNLLHFLTLRVDSHAQYEIQVFGQIMAGMLKRVAPLSYEAWIDYDVCGARMSRMEMGALRMLVGVEQLACLSGGTEPAVVGQDAGYGRAFLTSRLGMNDREVDEFLAKLAPKATPDFELDLSKAVDGSVFEERFKAASPT